MLRTRPIVYPKEQASALADDLRRRIRGEVRFDGGTRALYSTDASNYRQVPIGVVIPRDVDDIEATLAVCREHDAPILPRGCGTSLAGQCCNVAVVLDCSKYVNRILGIDCEGKRARSARLHLRQPAANRRAPRSHRRVRHFDPRSRHDRRHGRK